MKTYLIYMIYMICFFSFWGSSFSTRCGPSRQSCTDMETRVSVWQAQTRVRLWQRHAAPPRVKWDRLSSGYICIYICIYIYIYIYI